MDDENRRDAATATFGMAGVGTAAALRHKALERAYKKGKRPPVLQELQMLKPKVKGRGMYATGMALGAVSAPAAFAGTARLLTPNKRPVAKSDETKRKSFVSEGAFGVKRALKESNSSIHNPPPAKLALGNYLAGAAVGTGTGAAIHHVLGRTRLPGSARSAVAGMSMVGASAATLPVQSKLIHRASGGEYEVTPYGVRRKKTNAVRPSKRATTIEARPGRGGDPRHTRQQIVPSSVGKAYYGEDMTHAQKRRRVAAVTGPPIVGDIAQAAQAGRMAPPDLRKKTAAMTYVSGQAGGGAGTVAGAYGAAALARRSKKFSTGTAKVNDAMDSGKARARKAVHLPPKGGGPSLGAKALKKAPGGFQRAAQRAVRPLAGHGKAAAVGAFVLGGLGGVAGSQSGYGAALHMEDKYKAARSHDSQSARHGTRVAKAEGKVLSQREQVKLRRQKEQSAALSMAGSATGLTALGTSVGSKIPHVSPKIRGHLGKIPVPLLTAGAGLGGVNGLIYANIQHKEAGSKVKKAYLGRAGVMVRRAPSVRRGFVRQTRTINGIKTSAVRGSLA